MSLQLPRGGNTALAAVLGAGELRLRLWLEWGGDSPARPAVDALLFMLTASGQVRGDADMVFYNQMSSADGAVLLHKPELTDALNRQAFDLDLSRLDPAIEKLAICLSIHHELGGVTAISQLSPLQTCLESVSGARVLQAGLALPASDETAIIMAEIYKRNGEWKIKSVGQGFAAGLSALAQSYGIVVAEEAQAVPSSAPVQTPVTPGLSIAPAALYKPPHDGFGEILVNLNWGAKAAPAPPPAKAGLLGGLLGAKPKPPGQLDLDLCALYELSDGYRGIVQSLGGAMGAYNTAPYMQLLGDARGGGQEAYQGEIIRINGRFWGEIRRILLYAMIFEGQPNWAIAQGHAQIRVKDELPVGVRLNQNTNAHRACSIALIENVDGKMAIHKRVETFKNPKELDQHYGWGLRWTAGAKD